MAPAPVRLGLIGAGQWGKAYIRTVNQLPDVCLMRLCSSNPESRTLAPTECQITDDWRSLVESEDLDGVIIATPPALHAEIAIASLKAGLPVMVEKPMTVKIEEAVKIHETALETGTPILVDHTHLFQPAYRRLKQVAKDLGPVKAVRSIGGQWVKARQDVSPLWDYGPHDVALSIDFMGRAPITTRLTDRAEATVAKGYGEVVSLELEFPDGVVAAVTVGNALPEKRRLFAVEFDDETLVIDDLADTKLARYSNLPVHKLDHRSISLSLKEYKANPIRTEDSLPLTEAVKEFVEGIRAPHHLTPAFGVELAVEVTWVLAACEIDKEHRQIAWHRLY